jgi:23S rRNA pseudouridine1911/1915/1917 synthase
LFLDSSIDLFTVSDELHNLRLDKLLVLQYPSLQSRTYFQNLIEKGFVSVNGKPQTKKRILIPSGSEIEVQFENTAPPDLIPENIPLEILFEDDHIVVINKPAGMVVHPAPGNWTGTFVNALLFHCNVQQDDSLRPGIVHRLDKDTSGLLLAAKNLPAQRKLIEAFSSRQIYKEYLAICKGNPGKREINEPIGRHPVQRQRMTVRPEGKHALTLLNTLHSHQGISVVAATLHTGRTHQIRVHFQHIGCPLIGDPLYGANTQAARQMLHAWKLRFNHPITGHPLSFETRPPIDMQNFLSRQLPQYCF